MERLPAPGQLPPEPIHPEIDPDPGMKSIVPKPEVILTPAEAEILQAADAGVLSCPCCGGRLHGTKFIDEMYEGIVLTCTADIETCGFVEY